MRSNWAGFIPGLAAILAFSSMTLAQPAPAQSVKPPDISGYWDLVPGPAGSLNTLSNKRPPMTAWGKEQFSKVRNEFSGTALGNGVSAPQKDWNDPLRLCDPAGFPRILWLPKTPGMRFSVNPDEVFQFLEYSRTWRELWTDGRKLNPDAEPRWYGYSTARWQGNTFIVDTAGFMEASWLDQYGSPHSDELRVEERYRVADKDHLELIVTVTDPKTYTAPWVSDKKMLVRVTTPKRSAFNDLSENLCVWSIDKQ